MNNLKLVFASAIALLLATQAGIARAEDSAMNALTLGAVSIGEERIPLSLNQITVDSDIDSLIAEAVFVEGSVQWIRLDSVLLLPRARLNLTLKVPAADLILQYQGNTFVTQDKNGQSYIEMFIPLFSSGPIKVFVKGKLVGSIGFIIDGQTNNPSLAVDSSKNKRQAIDYSCSAVDLQFTGFDNEYLSAGCYMTRNGKLGAEQGTLEVRWATLIFAYLMTPNLLTY